MPNNSNFQWGLLCRWSPSCSILSWQRWREKASSLFSSCRDTNPIFRDAPTHDLFLNSLPSKGPLSKCYHIWGWGFNIWISEGHNSVHSKSVPKMIRSCSSTFLLIFCLVLIIERRVLKSSTIIVLFVCLSFEFKQFCFTFCSCFGAYTFKIAISSWWIDHFIIIISLSVSSTFFALKSIHLTVI